MPSMSAGGEPGVGDRGEARVERELERVAEQPPPDVGLPDAADDGGARGSRRVDGLSARVAPRRRVRRLEHRDPDVFVVVGLERDRAPACRSSTSSIAAVDDVGREPQAVLLGDPDDREHVRQLGHRHPGLVVHRVTCAPSRRPDTGLVRRAPSSGTSGRATPAGGGSSRSPGSAGTAARRRAPPSRRAGCDR